MYWRFLRRPDGVNRKKNRVYETTSSGWGQAGNSCAKYITKIIAVLSTNKNRLITILLIVYTPEIKFKRLLRKIKTGPQIHVTVPLGSLYWCDTCDARERGQAGVRTFSGATRAENRNAQRAEREASRREGPMEHFHSGQPPSTTRGTTPTRYLQVLPDFAKTVL